MWAHLGAMLAHLGAMLAHLGAMLAHLGAMLAHLGGYVGPMLAHLEVGPCWPILSHKIRKMGKMERARNTVERGTFWRHGDVRGGSPAGGAAPLSYGEERNAFGYATARGPLAGFKRLRATAGQGPMCRWDGPSWEQDLRAMLPHLEAMLVQLGAIAPSWGYVGPAWGYVGPPWRYVGLSWGLGWPILRPMLTHVEPKDPKNGTSKKAV